MKCFWIVGIDGTNERQIVAMVHSFGLSKYCLRNFNPSKRQPHKMVKHTQTIRRLLPTNFLMPTICLSVFDHFMLLALKGLRDFCVPISTLFLR